MTIGIFLAVLFAAMSFGAPIAFALMLTVVALMWHLDFFDAQLLAQNVLAGIDSFPLLAVPFFVLAGELMNAGGLSRRIIDLAQAFVGHVRGGLGLVAIAALIVMTGRPSWVSVQQRVEYVGLYWHFVDVVWIFLFPLLYLA